MSVPAPAARLRELRLGEVVDVSVRLCRANFGTLARIVLTIIVPLAILSFVLTVITTEDGIRYLADSDEYVLTRVNRDDAPGILLVLRTVVTVVSFLLPFIVLVACFRAISDAYLGREAGWRTSLRSGLRWLPSMIWLAIIVVPCLFVASLLLVIPGIWLAIVWSVAIPALMHEGLGGTKALRRSFRLVRHRWWPTFGTLLVAVILTFVVAFLVFLLLGVIFRAVAKDDLLLQIGLGQVAIILLGVIVTPFTAAVVAVVYFDLRVRKEAFDLQLLADEMGEGDGSALAGGSGFAPVEDVDPRRVPAAGPPAPPLDTNDEGAGWHGPAGP